MMTAKTNDADKKVKRPRKRSTVILFFSFAALFVMASGTGIYSWLATMKDVTPEAVRRRTQEIADIDIPDYFQPKEGISVGMFFSKKNVVIYETKDYGGIKGELMLTGLTGKLATAASKADRFIPSMRLYSEIYQNIDVEATWYEMVQVRGEESEFMFRRGTHRGTGTPFRLMEGSFPAKEGGMTYFYLQLPEKLFQKEEIAKMLRAIR